jgi:hypothetical protein
MRSAFHREQSEVRGIDLKLSDCPSPDQFVRAREQNGKPRWLRYSDSSDSNPKRVGVSEVQRSP